MKNWPRQVDLIFSGHALRQMFAREISVEDVRAAMVVAEVIADYPDDKPFPSRLFLAWTNYQPLHLVLAYDQANQKGIVVTSYRPDPTVWEADFKTRRKP